MKRTKYIVRKELIQLKRNKQMLPVILVLPLIQIFLLVYTATFEVTHVDTWLIDNDKNSSTRLLVEKFAATGRFTFKGHSENIREAESQMDRNNVSLIIIIPEGFEKKIAIGDNPTIQLILNAVDGSAAGITQSYAMSIINDFNKDIVAELTSGRINLSAGVIDVRERYWYNPELDYKDFMLPGLLVILVTMIGMFLASMNIVREKEIGTIEQLNVTPIKKSEFIIGKLFPIWLLAMFELAFGLTAAKLIFDLPIEGSLILLFGLAALYMLVVLGFGLLISTITNTQQQAMFFAWFFMVIFLLMSGFFTPIESMPLWAQLTTYANPIAQFIKIMRGVLIKGAGFMDVLEQTLILAFYAMFVITVSVWRYKKTGG